MTIRVAFKLPACLPCGCRLKNIHGARIGTHALILPDATLVCRCARRWKPALDGVGGFAELPRIKLLKELKG